MSELRWVKAKTMQPTYKWMKWIISEKAPYDSYDKNTLCMFTGMSDVNGKMIWEDDIVEFLGKRGKIVYCKGTFGIEFTEYVAWIDIDKKVTELTGNNPHFVYNDNFISLWEIYWNFNEMDNFLHAVEVVGNVHDVVKIPVCELEIIVTGTKEKPYYEIKYFDLRDKKYHIGFSSYNLDNVYAWKDESFRLVEKFYENDSET